MNYTKTIELVGEQIDAIVVKELQQAYEMNMSTGSDEGELDIGYDSELLESLDCVLQYFMVPSEYDEWKESITSPPKENKFKDIIVKVGVKE